jgi:FkbM family methyltransferase
MSLKRAVLNRTKDTLARAGVSLTWYPPPGSYERHLKTLLDNKNINCVLDVGGFDGTYASDLRASGYEGLIISFEPVASSYALLTERMKADRAWIGQPYGLSSSSRQAMIHTYDKGDFNSLLNLKDEAEKAYGLDSAKRSEVAIQLRRLDEVLLELVAQHLSAPPKIYMKLDTQGHDKDVFQGADKVLSLIEGFQSEVPAIRCYDGMPSMPQLIEYYAGHGFVPIGFYPVNTFASSMVTPEFDVLFTRYSGTLSE